MMVITAVRSNMVNYAPDAAYLYTFWQSIALVWEITEGHWWPSDSIYHMGGTGDHCNHTSILHRFCTTVTYWPKTVQFS